MIVFRRMTKIYFINDLHWDFWKKQNYSLEKFFEEFFLPADVCCIAGDIANDFIFSSEILKYLKGRYKKIIYTLGNHDLGIFKKDKYKSLLQRTINKKQAFSNVIGEHLDGNIIKVNGITFGGSCGSCDWSWVYKNFETDDGEYLTKWQDWFDYKWWRMGSTSPWQIFEWEINKLKKVAEQKPNIFVTHFHPLSCPIPDSYKNDKMTGVFIYDDSVLNLQPGTIYHFGHTHSKIKLEQNGILYLNNCIGYPGDLIYEFGQFKKEDFLLELMDKNDT